MDRLEFSKRLIKVLEDDEIKEVLKKASSKGFSVPGFKNPWKAPITTVIRRMEQKGKEGEYHYMLLLDIISELNVKEDEKSNSPSKVVREWKENGKIVNEQIEYDLVILEEKNKYHKKSAADEICICADDKINNYSEINLEEKNEALKEKNKLLQDKNKKLQALIQSNKIEIGDYKQEINKIQGENSKLMNQINELLNNLDQCLKEKDEAIKKSKEIEDHNLVLINQINELEKYRECAPKIICFIKAKVKDEEFKGYNIVFVKEWNNKYENNIVSNMYDEVWMVHKGFSYNDITEIKGCARCEVKEYLNISQLRNEMEEKNEYNR